MYYLTDAVALYANGNIVAIGTILDLPSIHGHPIPKRLFMCCVVVDAKQLSCPPYPLGRKDPMENILHKDMFYAETIFEMQ